jgi:cytidylate kinase
MTHAHQIDLCRAYLHSATADARRPPDDKPDGPVITISRAAGARGNTIAEELIRQLQAHPHIRRRHPWTLFNQNLVQQVIEEHALPEKTADYFPEDHGGEISSFIAEILGLHPGTHTTVRKTAETIRRIGKSGFTVIVGRGANFLTADIAHAVHVRLTGSEKARVRHYARHFQLSQEAAAREVARLDRARKRYIRANFRADIGNPLHYDMVLNTDELDDATAARVIIGALEGKIA